MSLIMEARKHTDFHQQFCKRFLKKCVVGDMKWRSNHLKLPLGSWVVSQGTSMPGKTAEVLSVGTWSSSWWMGGTVCGAWWNQWFVDG